MGAKRGIRWLVIGLLAAIPVSLAGQGGGTIPQAMATAPVRVRVVAVEAPDAMPAFQPNRTRIREMVEAGLTNLAAVDRVDLAWRTWIAPEDVVGFKVISNPGRLSGTRPAVVEALVSSLLDAGHAPERILVWDKHLSGLQHAGFTELTRRFGIEVAGAVEAGYDPAVFYDNAIPGQLVWGDLEFRAGGETMGRRSHVTRLLTRRITRVINVTPLLNHNLIGVSGNLFSLALGSVDNTHRFTGDIQRLAVAIPEIVALPEISERLALHVVDGLVAQYYGETESLLHYAFILNQIRFSTDPVALDVLSIEQLARQRELAAGPPVRVDRSLYQNASLLELGVSHLPAIRLERIDLARPSPSAFNPPETAGRQINPAATLVEAGNRPGTTRP